MAALMIKESVNQTVDNMGFYNSLNACFTVHELNHSHWSQVHDNRYPIALEEAGIQSWKTAPPVVPSAKDKVSGERLCPWRAAGVSRGATGRAAPGGRRRDERRVGEEGGE